MILLILVIFFISLIFVIKVPILNKLITYPKLSYLKEFMRDKLGADRCIFDAGKDIFNTNNDVFHEDSELFTAGNNIKHVGADSNIVYHSIDLSRFINNQQGNHSFIT